MNQDQLKQKLTYDPQNQHNQAGGVSWCMGQQKWIVQIRVNKTQAFSQLFVHEENARLANKLLRMKFHGEFAYEITNCDRLNTWLSSV